MNNTGKLDVLVNYLMSEANETNISKFGFYLTRYRLRHHYKIVNLQLMLFKKEITCSTWHNIK